MKKVLIALFCGIFFVSCAFFSLGMMIPGASHAAEGAGDMPAFIGEDGINDDFGDEFETWFSKSFAFRSNVVDAFSDFREKVFATGNDQVIVGKDGFLFFADTVDAFTGIDPMTDDEIGSAADSLEALSEYAAAQGSRFVFAPAPDKNTVYPDMMPDRYKKGEAPSDMDRLFAELEVRGIDFVDLRPVLRSAADDELIYHKLDTHWNAIGALYAFNEIMNFVGKDVPDFGERIEDHSFVGDLAALLYPGRTVYDDDITFDFSDKFIYTSAYSNPMDLIISTRGAGDGRLLIFRDSFGSALIPYAAGTYSEVKFERANPYRIDLLSTFKADLVIVEVAERNLRDLIGSDGRIGK